MKINWRYSFILGLYWYSGWTLRSDGKEGKLEEIFGPIVFRRWE
jgi:hypothetical protein